MPDSMFSVLPDGRDARVTFIMPVRNEARDLPATLASLAAQTFPHARMQLFIIDGASEDQTRVVAEQWFAQHDIAGAVVPNIARTIPSGLNAGIRAADPRDIIVRLDGHTLYAPTYVETLIETLENAPGDVACVGGPQRPVSDASFEHRLVATLYANPMGLGGADHRGNGGVKYVTQVYLGAWRPGVLQQLGGFDERFRANEDSELSARILAVGWKILWAPLDCAYAINRGVRKTIEQWGGYGFWRAQTLRRYPSLAKPRHFAAPGAMVIGVMLLVTPLRWLVAVGAVAYAALVIAKRNPAETLPVSLAGIWFFPLCQIAWSLGLLRGLLFTPPPFQAYVGPNAVRKSPGAARLGDQSDPFLEEEQQASALER